MKVVIRTDASLEIGSGHVMRCLTLANRLKARGAEVVFICRNLEGEMTHLVTRCGFHIRKLPAPEGPLPSPPPSHAEWARVSWQQDAAETAAELAQLAPNWLILDHYAFDTRWQRSIRKRGLRVLVLDDLADRPHDAEVLIDQSIGRRPADYDALLPEGADCLLGPRYAILRPEFAALRAAALAARAERAAETPRRLLIAMGGTDLGSITHRVLEALNTSDLPKELQIEIIMGSGSRTLARVRSCASRMRWTTKVAVDVTDMAARMASADLAIGAGGGSTWERCALGLPTIMVPVARNQEAIVRGMISQGAATGTGSPNHSNFARNLNTAVERLCEHSVRRAMAERAAALCDGDGVARIFTKILPSGITFRSADLTDSRRIWEWRKERGDVRSSKRGVESTFAAHHEWLGRALTDPARVFRILKLGELPIGYVRLDRTQPDSATISICLAEEARGQSLSAVLLKEAARIARHLNLTRIEAEIHRDNIASLRAFRGAGYVCNSADSQFHRYHQIVETVR